MLLDIYVTLSYNVDDLSIASMHYTLMNIFQVFISNNFFGGEEIIAFKAGVLSPLTAIFSQFRSFYFDLPSLHDFALSNGFHVNYYDLDICVEGM